MRQKKGAPLKQLRRLSSHQRTRQRVQRKCVGELSRSEWEGLGGKGSARVGLRGEVEEICWFGCCVGEESGWRKKQSQSRVQGSPCAGAHATEKGREGVGGFWGGWEGESKGRRNGETRRHRHQHALLTAQ